MTDELTDPFHINLLGHGTNGSDGIESGIHLRWAFNHKLGFPDCVRLFRRPSFSQNHYIWNYLAQAFKTLFIPSTHEVPNGVVEFDFIFESLAGVSSFPIVAKTFDAQTHDVVYIGDGELRINFSLPVSRIELGFLIPPTTPSSNFQIIVDSAGESYYPQSVLGSFPGWKDIYFDAPGATGLTLRGKEINLFHLAVWICSEVEANPWQEIKLMCGCGLPLIPASKPAPHMIDNVVPVIDVPKIDCRLGPGGGPPAPFTRNDILEISDLFLDIFQEGSTLPHGWTLFDTTSSTDPDEATPEVSIYDYLLAQCLYVPVAKAFDLYFVDKPQNPNIYFDYKIETAWPEWNLRQLDQQITFDEFELGQRFDNLFSIGDLFFLDAGSPEIVEASNPLARTNLGLALSDTVPVTIFRFLKPVTDVQLWLLNPAGEVVVEAHQNYHITYKDKRVLNEASGIVRVHADQIDSIRIQGRNVILSRLHYEDEPAPYFGQSTMICGVKRGTNAYPLEKPSDLTVSFIPGGLVNTPDLTHTEVPYQAGLRWETNEDENKKLLPHHPFGYHLQRSLNNGPIELLTQDAPLLISPQSEGSSDIQPPEGWPEQRQFYLDHLDNLNQNKYRISALDLWGRQSPYGEFKTYTVNLPPPPSPTQVTAHYLDFNAYDPSTNTSTDPALLEIDKDWLRTNQKSAIVVRWQWPAELAARAPEVDGFRILLKHGWLNTYAGTIISAITETTIPKASLKFSTDELNRYPLLDTYTDIPVLSFRVALSDGAQFTRDALRLCWLRQGNAGFLVLTNTTGSTPTLNVLKFEDPSGTSLSKDQGVSLSITADKRSFIDYTLPQNWTTTNPLQHFEPKHVATTYTVYIPAPPFPAHPLTLKSPTAYGQIGVCAVANLIDGSVSIPATIMAIYQDKPAPPAPAVSRPSYRNLDFLKATPADVHGKSTFALRWRTSGNGVQHFVYRAMDTTLFLVDNARRSNGDSADYTPFSGAKYAPADVDVIRQLDHIASADVALAQYASLTASQLFILANLAANSAAYTRLHGQPIHEDDSNYQDQDPNLLLYSDNTIDGRGTNRYFYRVKTTGANGLSSEFGESTLPVEAPRTTPPPRPVITAINGGENQITINWAKQPGAAIAGYLLYRTQEKRFSTDWRRMDLIQTSETDNFTVLVNELPQQGFEFVDTSVIPRQAYFYGVVAVGLSDSGKHLKSIISAAKVGQAYDLAPPPPPEFVSLERAGDQTGITVKWKAVEPLSFLLKRADGDSGLFRSISEWVDEGTFEETTATWHYEFVDEQGVRSDTEYTYLVIARDQSGNLSSSEESDPV